MIGQVINRVISATIKRRKHLYQKALAVLLLLAISFFGTPSTAHLGQTGEILLKEIEDYIKGYYIYRVEEKHFPLQSLEELPAVFQDPYSAYLDKERMDAFRGDLDRILPGGIGLSLEQKGSGITVTSVFNGTPAQRAGIQSGDLIISVDGNFVSSLTAEEVALRIRGEKGSKVKLLLRRENEDLGFSLVREKIALPLVESSWVDRGIALLRIYSFGEGLAGEMATLLKELRAAGLEGLILDLCNNQGGYVEEALAMCSLFTDGVLLNVRERDRAWQEIQGPAAGMPFSIPTVVLVNGGTASAGEIVAAALKENRVAALVGGVTFGKGTMQTLFELDGEGCLKLTTAEFISPRGRIIEGCGVEPQYLVPAGGDQLQVALGILHGWPVAGEGIGLSQPIRWGGQAYYPLRSTLQVTGRGIAAGELPGVYLFYWNSILYRLDLGKKILSWVDDSSGATQSAPILLHQGSTYVQEKFLKKMMELPF